jgi:hypothetical protein
MVAPKPLISLRPSFRRFPLERQSKAPITSVAGVPVRHASVMRFKGAVNSVLHESALTTLHVPFGALSQQRFDQLWAAFGRRSQVTYSPSGRYELIDFLPPVIQAVINLDLELPAPATLVGSRGWDQRDPETELSVVLDANCHGTAWSFARACRSDARQMLVFYGDMLAMDNALSGPRFHTLESLAMGQLNLLGVIPMQPGDVVGFYEVSEWPRVTMLLHTAVHVGAGLFVEKPNTEMAGEDSPYRLGTAEMIASPLLHAIGPSVRAVVFRPKGPMSPAAQVFETSYTEQLVALSRSGGRPIGMPIVAQREFGLGGGISSETMCAIATMPISFGDDGRARLTGVTVEEQIR